MQLLATTLIEEDDVRRYSSKEVARIRTGTVGVELIEALTGVDPDPAGVGAILN